MVNRNELVRKWMIKNSKKWNFILDWISNYQIPKLNSSKAMVTYFIHFNILNK